MTDYTKLVEALRYCGNFTEREGCDESCEYFNDMDCPNRIMSDAAAAIEALQAQVKRLNMRCADCEYASKPWPELEPKLGEWELIDGAEPMRWGCSRCKYLSWETSSYCPRCGAKMEVQE